MARKQHNPQARDMQVIVPIHNAVNERTWAAVKAWEKSRGGEKCGGVKLVSFKGRPGDRSPKAWAKVLLGQVSIIEWIHYCISDSISSYTAPFDRHDWIVDRCGKRIRYIIDFYSGRSDPSSPHLPSFYIDARPALDTWDGVKMRFERIRDRWIGVLLDKKGS